MPLDYAGPFGRTGGAVGGIGGAAAGGGFMGGLGRLLEPFDNPRQALWNMPRKLLEGDWAAALPGVVGLSLGAGLAATGVGLPLAFLGGSALGGGLQAAMKGYGDEGRYDAPEPSHLAQALGADPESFGGQALGLGLGMALDPLSWSGLGGGGQLGKQLGTRAGSAAGTAVEGAARARGPMYEGGVEKLLKPNARKPDEVFNVMERAMRMRGSPEASRIAGEIPPGMTEWHNGLSSFVGIDPGTGHVVNITGGPGSWDSDALRIRDRHTMAPPGARIPSDLMNQPVRQLTAGPYRIEHLPRLDILPGNTDPAYVAIHGSEAEKAALNDMMAGATAMGSAAQARGLSTSDLINFERVPTYFNAGNIGKTAEGNFLISDAGSLATHGHDVPTGLVHVPPEITGQPGMGMNALLGALDRMPESWGLSARKGVQAEIAERLAAGTKGRGLPPDLNLPPMPPGPMGPTSPSGLAPTNRVGMPPDLPPTNPVAHLSAQDREMLRRAAMSPSHPPTLPGRG